MTVEEIPPGEQLMASSEPRVPANMQFLIKGLVWPAPEAIQSNLDKAAERSPDLLTDTIGWIRQVLKPEFVAPDLRERLRAARAIISGQDAFLARYKMDQYNIQIIVTQFHLHLVIAPVSVSPVAGLHQFLQVDQPSEPHPWNASWQTGQIDGLTYGYQPRGYLGDWRESLLYLTNGQAVKVSLEKIAMLPPGSGRVKTIIPPTEEAERHWFAAKP